MSDLNKKLYKVTLRGMTYTAGGIVYGVSYVVANDSNEALLKVQKYLNDADIGNEYERELDNIELIAEKDNYAKCGAILYL